MRHLIKSVLLILTVNFAWAQSGTLEGKVTDKGNGEGIPFANIVVEQNGVQKGGASTDFDGNYSIKPLPPGKYDVKVTYVGYQPFLTTGVLVNAEKITFLNVGMSAGIKLDEVEVVEYKIPLIQKDETATGQTVTQEELAKLPTRSINSFVSTAAGVSQADEGKNIFVRGARADANQYIVDGVKVRGSASLPVSAIDQMSVITGGTPSRYGDATGGVVVITTRGASKNFGGGVELVTSELLDRYGYNLISGNISGPVIMKNKGTNTERALLGFFVAGDFERHKDYSPSAVGIWKLRDDKLDEIKATPLVELTPGVITKSAEYLRAEDFENVKARPNLPSNVFRLSSKFDLVLNDRIQATFGGSLSFGRLTRNIYSSSLMNWDNFNMQDERTWRTYFRLTHQLSKKKTDQDKEKSASVFQNAYYTLQVDYEKFFIERYDARHKKDYFKYGYVGNFTTYRSPFLEQLSSNDTLWVRDASTGNYVKFTGSNTYRQTAFQVDSLYYTPSDINPDVSRLTSSYLSLFNDDGSANKYYGSIEQLDGQAWVNGNTGSSIYSLWNLPGTISNSYLISNRGQLRGTVSASFDIVAKGKKESQKHSLEVGYEIEKRTDRIFSIGPVGLWTLMRNEANKQIETLNNGDSATATIVYGTTDSIYFERAYNPDAQTYFDKSLRKKLGRALNGLDYIDIDKLSPETFSLDMFSPDELLNNGSEYVSAFGYDYTGERLKKQPKFEDFWTQKDENGNFARPQPASTPLYMGTWLQDKFSFRDLVFNVGLRVDRYDANQKVLKDRYSLYPVKTKSQVSGALNTSNGGSHPGNIGDDYAVYVGNLASPNIIGYREGDNWYTATGTRTDNPADLSNLSGGNLVPYLVDENMNIQSPDFNPAQSFKDYDPQYSFMPRIAFSFPISDEALFFAHYDVLTQRPSFGGFFLTDPNNTSAFDYYYMQERVNSTTFDNPDLKPQRTIDYQIGFKQKTSKSSALSIEAFYREIKDMVQLRKFIGAYPVEYTSYDNRDFGTTKGLTFSFDLRRTNNVSLRFNYTLQFASGTGSDANSQSTLIAVGQPNLRTIYPLSYDQRHIFSSTLDYRFEKGSEYNGPKWWGKDVFAGAGANFTFFAGSGYPYSKYAIAVPIYQTDQRFIGKKGDPQGSRLPWTFRINMRVDKDFDVNLTKKDSGKKPRKLVMNAYVLVQNLLDTRNILGVYNFTGSATDDGYLASPAGQDEIESKTPSKESYVDLYNIFLNSPGNFSLPRIVRFGVIANF